MIKIQCIIASLYDSQIMPMKLSRKQMPSLSDIKPWWYLGKMAYQSEIKTSRIVYPVLFIFLLCQMCLIEIGQHGVLAVDF